MIELKYSQNYIKNSRIVQDILSLTNISKNDVVYEIGAGKGIITKELCNCSNSVIASELDYSLYIFLKEKFARTNNLKLIHGDFLKLDLPSTKYKIFANIPFQITASIIHKITNIKDAPTDSYLIIQKEAALKYSGFLKESMQALLLKPLFSINIIKYLNRTEFTPEPNVDIVVIHIQKKKNIVVDYELYQNFICYFFSKYNTNIKSSFKELFSYEQIKRLGKINHFNIKDNVSTLTFNEWFPIFQFFLTSCSNKHYLVENSYEKYQKQQSKVIKRHRNQ